MAVDEATPLAAAAKVPKRLGKGKVAILLALALGLVVAGVATVAFTDTQAGTMTYLDGNCYQRISQCGSGDRTWRCCGKTSVCGKNPYGPTIQTIMAALIMAGARRPRSSGITVAEPIVKNAAAYVTRARETD